MVEFPQSRVSVSVVVALCMLPSLALLCGCDSLVGSSNFEATPGPPQYPLCYQDPEWGPLGLIAYRDNGVVSINLESGSVSVEPELCGIWVLDPETGNRLQVTDFGWDPTWSPDGTHLAFTSGDALWTVGLGGETPELVVQWPDSWEPDWSPDGLWLAWCQTIGSPGGILVTSLEDGSTQHVRSLCSDPDWHPTEQRILCAGWLADGVHAIAELNPWISGGAPETLRISESNTGGGAPEYSPGGSHIAFQFHRVGAPYELWVMNTDTRGERLLAANGAIDPSWSPDGHEIVFTRRNNSSSAPEDNVLWVVDVITGREQQLIRKWTEIDSVAVSALR